MCDNHACRLLRPDGSSFLPRLERLHAGDLLEPINTGALDREKIRDDLAGLATGRRTAPHGISVFKSVGIASADFAAATLALETVAGQSKAQAA